MTILAIHGGAGGDGPWRGLTSLDPERIRCMHHVLQSIGDALDSGSIDALEAVTMAVELMENEPLFNAGIGSVLDEDGTVTMDASIMNGPDGAAGSVVNVRRIRHPIRAANCILKQGWPVMLNSEAADVFAINNGVEEVKPSWLVTDLRQKQWDRWRENNARPGATDEDDSVLDHDLEGMGTVGAVALDKNGDVAAATSTGGMTGKPKGRIGDTPIIGAGTWADQHIAVSCTGVGEAFIRTCAAHRLASKFESGLTLDEACSDVLDAVEPIGGRGGVIAVTTNGEVATPFQTMLMYRGVWMNGEITIGIGPNDVDLDSMDS
ncbi:MAG TPA: isoaspartyl peptidase/L-asparaginase [Candidatus Poseidoniales archaeon]|nr:MAG TPA: isoaspartyl peptidase/L-asparaginase [Candidatus Poseidoniales archaeon]HII56835.1 isoaspartyl peptidase/L-asparaginase [Candidatus Poseidoniaceae archaeon]|tara:strand:- start:2506 stop:3468 length:963 start_codon:yes stop_codon:yes gene_type:complete